MRISTRSSASHAHTLLGCTLILFIALILSLSTSSVSAQSSSNCDVYKELYADCVFRLDFVEGKQCDDCRIETIKALDEGTPTCEELQTGLCTAVTETCYASCGSECASKLEAFWQCTTEQANNGTCSIDCELPTDTNEDLVRMPTTADELELEPLCPNEFELYKFCVTGQFIPNGQVCDECRLAASNAIPKGVTDCKVVQDVFCKAVASCPCGVCAGPMENYLDCDVSKRWFGECNIDCGVAGQEQQTQFTAGLTDQMETQDQPQSGANISARANDFRSFISLVVVFGAATGMVASTLL